MIHFCFTQMEYVIIFNNVLTNNIEDLGILGPLVHFGNSMLKDDHDKVKL